ncbi:DNA polymerase III subunit gamma and tau [Dietzia timorensis]|uniref:DNA polymerase III subunit gamma/tau n=3 Tax=Dietzia timorensis TaxID=499555 RepID=A0A173LG56_9ACTN|nr:DNA polymerase III subunit gamma and tau [Dietzia timorensis]ANI91286.1 DNA polymerase III subunit gamma/tau [Dietzia timorensis]
MALYRKYRPATFAEVVGQEHVTDPLSAALRSGRINHAFLFSGPRGCGKTSSARIMARSLNCVEGPTPEPCGVCDSCVSLAPGGPGNLDVIELDAASHGNVDDTRELREKAFYAPASSRYRVFIIDEAHMVSNAGFNALLKIVEEPPVHLIFIFATTEPEKVLPTIKSRTHHYPFRLLTPTAMRALLERICESENVRVDPPVFPLVIRQGGGSPRDTLSVLDQLVAGSEDDHVEYSGAAALLGVTENSLLDATVESLAAADGAALFRTVDRVIEAGHDPRRFVSDLLQRMRDLIMVQSVPQAIERGLVDAPGEEAESLARQADSMGPATLARLADEVHSGLDSMRGATSPRLLLEILCARLLLPEADGGVAALSQRVEQLERGVGSVSAGSAGGAENASAPAPAADGGVPAGAGAATGSESAPRYVRPSQRRKAEQAGGAPAAAEQSTPEQQASAQPEPEQQAPQAVPRQVPQTAADTAQEGPAEPAAESAATEHTAEEPAETPEATPAGNQNDDASGDSSAAMATGAAASGAAAAGAVAAGTAAGTRDEQAAPPREAEPGAPQPGPAQPKPAQSVETAPVAPAEAQSAGAQGWPEPARPANENSGDREAREAPAPARSLDTEELRRAWPEVRRAVRERSRTLEVMLADAVITRVEGNEVVLSHKTAALANRINEPHHASTISEAMSAVFGGTWHARAERDGAPAGGRQEPQRAFAPRQPEQAPPEPQAPQSSAPRGRAEQPRRRPQPVEDVPPPPEEPEPPADWEPPEDWSGEAARPEGPGEQAPPTSSAPRVADERGDGPAGSPQATPAEPAGDAAEERQGRRLTWAERAAAAQARAEPEAPAGQAATGEPSGPEVSEQDMVDEARSGPQNIDHRTPEEIALALLKEHLGATPLE